MFIKCALAKFEWEGQTHTRASTGAMARGGCGRRWRNNVWVQKLQLRIGSIKSFVINYGRNI